MYQGFARITREQWSECVRHAIDVEEQKYWTSDGLTPIPRVIMNLQSDDEIDERMMTKTSVILFRLR